MSARTVDFLGSGNDSTLNLFHQRLNVDLAFEGSVKHDEDCIARVFNRNNH